MRTQQQAERAEQQRIKSLVLNYDLMDEASQQYDGESASYPSSSFGFVRSSGGRCARLVGMGSFSRSLKSPPLEPSFVGGTGHFQHSTRDTRAISAAEDGLDSAEEAVISKRQDSFTDETGSYDGAGGIPPRLDKAGNSRSKQRARKLQLGDIDWYGRRPDSNSAPALPEDDRSAGKDEYILDTKPQRGGDRRQRRTFG